MADYHPLISRAVAGLDKNTGENRRALYERARTALVAQLRGVEPPLDESDITRERLALEEAIRKVEADAAKRTRDDEISFTPPESRPSSLSNQGLRGFREGVTEAEGLGGAAAEARAFGARGVRGGARRAPCREHAEDVHYFEPPGSEPPPPVSEPELMDEAPPPARVRGHELPEGALPQSYEDEAFARPARSWGGLIKLVAAAAGDRRAGRRRLLAAPDDLDVDRKLPLGALQAAADRRAALASENQRSCRRRRRRLQHRHGARRRGRAEGRALRRRPQQSAGRALCRLGDLAHRNGIARTGSGARARRARRRRYPRTPRAHDLVASPQHRQGAAGEPHHRGAVLAAGGFRRGRHRQHSRHPDENGRGRARRAARRPRGQGDQQLFPRRPVGARDRRPAQSRNARSSATGSMCRWSIPAANAPSSRSKRARRASAPSRKPSAPGGSRR